MRHALLSLCVAAASLSPAATAHAQAVADTSPPSQAFAWLDFALEGVAREVERDGARPTIDSRSLAMMATAMYDAWAAYDPVAVGTRLSGRLRRPATERTDANKSKAMGYALYRILIDAYPEDAAWATEQFQAKGLEPTDTSTDPATPAGVGNLAAQALLDHRRHDGSNQFGDEVGSNGKPFSDYTYYRPVNPPDQILDPDRWQMIPFDDGKGGKIYVNFLTAHWYRVKTYALERADQFRPGPPPLVGSDQLKAEVDECIRFNASLTPEQKAIVEFMRDGPRSTGQSGHWLRFAQMASRRDRNNLDRDVKLYFAVANAAFDAFISAWDAKRFYDSSRPWTLVRYYYAGQEIDSWGGPGEGVRKIPAELWHPYSPSTFVTPPFPGYVSGHSTVSAACARTLALFHGSDAFGESEHRLAGALTEPGFACELMQRHNGQAPNDPHLTCDTLLPLPTFTATAEMAGISRVMGGYHIQADNVAGLELGRTVADFIWPATQAYFDGTAPADAP